MCKLRHVMVDVRWMLLEVRATAGESFSGEGAFDSVEQDGRRRTRPDALLPKTRWQTPQVCHSEHLSHRADGHPNLVLFLRYHWAVPILRQDDDKRRRRATLARGTKCSAYSSGGLPPAVLSCLGVQFLEKCSSDSVRSTTMMLPSGGDWRRIFHSEFV